MIAIVFLLFAAAVNAGVAPGYPADVDAYPRYSYGYGVADGVTGDNKNQVETREGGVVRGQYTVADPDGTLRVVKYTADPENGFNAVVTRSRAPGGAVIPAPAPRPAYVAPTPSYVAPAIYTPAASEDDAYARYSYGYGVADGVTGDNKNQVETREGGVVRGQYTVADPDGTVRVVKYTADPKNGFNAVVSRTPAAGAKAYYG